MTLVAKAQSYINRLKNHEDAEVEAYITDLKTKMIARLEIVWADFQRRIEEDDVKSILVKDVFVYELKEEFAKPFLWDEFAHLTKHLLDINGAFNEFKAKVDAAGFSISFQGSTYGGSVSIYIKIKEGQ